MYKKRFTEHIIYTFDDKMYSHDSLWNLLLSGLLSLVIGVLNPRGDEGEINCTKKQQGITRIKCNSPLAL